MTTHDLISTPAGLVAAADEWFGVAVPARLAFVLASMACEHENRWETSAGPVCWLKSRMLEHSLIGNSGGLVPPIDHPTAVLHVGFLSLPESDEMIERLRNEPSEEPNVARSKIGEELRRVAVLPIDATARRVGGR